MFIYGNVVFGKEEFEKIIPFIESVNNSPKGFDFSGEYPDSDDDWGAGWLFEDNVDFEKENFKEALSDGILDPYVTRITVNF